jgi:hypothetical protein
VEFGTMTDEPYETIMVRARRLGMQSPGEFANYALRVLGEGDADYTVNEGQHEMRWCLPYWRAAHRRSRQ